MNDTTKTSVVSMKTLIPYQHGKITAVNIGNSTIIYVREQSSKKSHGKAPTSEPHILYMTLSMFFTKD